MWWNSLVGKLFLCFVCVTGEVNGVYAGKPVGTFRLTEKENGTEMCRFILQDDEPSKVLFDEGQRSFYVNRPVQLRLRRKKELLLRFYSPRPVRNLIVWGKWKGMEEQVKLAEFELLPPFAEIPVPLLFTKNDAFYPTRSGGQLRVKQCHVEELETEIECDDPYYLKIASSKCNWRVSFGEYRGKNWTPLLPAHAREAVAIALNLAYLFSSEEFVRELRTRQGKLYADNHRTEVDVEELYRRIFALKALVYGHVTGVNGLGGGSVFGLAEWCYLEHYADDTGVTRTIFHEFAHCLGYDHTGNMTYENGLGKGWVALCSRLYKKMGIQGELPVYSKRFLSTRECHHRYGKDMQLATSEAVSRN